MAASLGYFFRNHPEYFKSQGAFVIGGGIDEFRKYMDSRPEDLNDYINEKVLPEPVYATEFRDFKWFDDLGGDYDKLDNYVRKIREILEDLESAKDKAIKKQASGDEKASKDVSDYINQISNLKKESLLDSLSKYCVIPKYGFPVDVVDLQIYDNGAPVTKYDMNRDLKIAVSQYAPDSEVVVDGNKYVSKYITLRKQTEFPKTGLLPVLLVRRSIFLLLGTSTNVASIVADRYRRLRTNSTLSLFTDSRVMRQRKALD